MYLDAGLGRFIVNSTAADWKEQGYGLLYFFGGRKRQFVTAVVTQSQRNLRTKRNVMYFGEKIVDF